MNLLNLTARALAAVFRSNILDRAIFMAPARHLYDLDGITYMSRWHVIREGTFASRVLERLTGYSSIRLHHLTRGDHDRDLHNHPFTYRTFILHGWYVEEVKARRGAAVVQQPRFAGETAQQGPLSFHRIAEVGPGGVWTLFCMTRNTGAWGFLRKGRFVLSSRYLKARGFDATNPR